MRQRPAHNDHAIKPGFAVRARLRCGFTESFRQTCELKTRKVGRKTTHIAAVCQIGPFDAQYTEIDVPNDFTGDVKNCGGELLMGQMPPKKR